MGDLLARLERRIDLNSVRHFQLDLFRTGFGCNLENWQTHDCFSYKHFYVLYCKFWLLDQDHDLIVSQNDMLQYNSQVLTSRITARVMKCGKIMAFPRDTQVLSDTEEATLTYMDFICKLCD